MNVTVIFLPITVLKLITKFVEIRWDPLNVTVFLVFRNKMVNVKVLIFIHLSTRIITINVNFVKDIPECDKVPSPCPDHENEYCNELLGNYTCECKNGFLRSTQNSMCIGIHLIIQA